MKIERQAVAEVNSSSSRKPSQLDTACEPRLRAKVPLPGGAVSGLKSKRGCAQRACDVDDVARLGAGAGERFTARDAAAAHDVDDNLMKARKVASGQRNVRFPGKSKKSCVEALKPSGGEFGRQCQRHKTEGWLSAHRGQVGQRSGKSEVTDIRRRV